MNENDSKDAKAADVIASAKFTWGSAQYDGAAALYTKLCKEEAESSRAMVLAKLSSPDYGLKVGPVRSFDEAQVVLKKALLVDTVDREVIGDAVSELEVPICNLRTVTEVLHFLREQAWDLWSAAFYVAQFIFPELSTGPACPEHATGLTCWLLKSYGYVADDEPFKEWDT